MLQPSNGGGGRRADALLMVISLSEMELQAPEPNGQGGRLGAGGGAAGG